jgi:hypothetical protein
MLQRLNLVSPDPESPSRPSQPIAGPNVSPAVPQPNPESVKEVKRRAELILKSGQVPPWVFICGVSGGILTFQPGTGKKPVMLLFTTPYAAQDYIRATKATAEVRQLKFDSLPGIAPGWIAAGADTFVLNRCPRCTVMTTVGTHVMKEMDKLLEVWAICRATKLYQGEIKVREFMQFQNTSRPRARAVLEQIRDHIDCGIPYLHELIAFYARLDQDQAAMTEAVERLKEFGPQFANWESKWDVSSGVSSSFTESLAVAIVGLAKNFGIEFTPRP